MQRTFNNEALKEAIYAVAAVHGIDRLEHFNQIMLLYEALNEAEARGQQRGFVEGYKASASFEANRDMMNAVSDEVLDPGPKEQSDPGVTEAADAFDKVLQWPFVQHVGEPVLPPSDDVPFNTDECMCKDCVRGRIDAGIEAP